MMAAVAAVMENGCLGSGNVAAVVTAVDGKVDWREGTGELVGWDGGHGCAVYDNDDADNDVDDGW